MSIAAINAVFRFSVSKGSQRCLMIAIADGVNPDSERYIAGKGKLSARANVEKRWIRRLVGKAIAVGELIVWEGRAGERNVYAIPILAGEPGYVGDDDPAAVCSDTTHICLGKHTPLSVSREDPNRVAMGGGARRKRPRGGGLQTTRGGAHKPPTGGLQTTREGSVDPPISNITVSIPNSVPRELAHTHSQVPNYTDWKAGQPLADRERFDRKASAGLLAYRLWCAANGMEARQ